MTNKNKAKGSDWERKTRVAIRERGHQADKIALAGQLDESDIMVQIMAPDGSVERRIVVECKATAKFEYASFVNQAIAERDAYCKARGFDPKDYEAVVFYKRRQKGFWQGYAITTIDEYLRLRDTPKI